MWVINAYRAGEQSQLLALAEALGWPFEFKRIRHRKLAWRTNLFRGSDLGGIDVAGSDALQPPWPDFVLAAGMRNEPVCRWIREQSGGETRIVHVGRPWANPENFDLVITTPQYRLPRRDNVVQNRLTLHRVSEQRLSEARAQWAEQLAIYPEPRIAVIVGGNSGPYTLGPRAGQRLLAQARKLADARGGSLLITTSSRTDKRVVEQLQAAAGERVYCYRWQPDDTANPYFGLLAMADEFIVTADSISMLSEACATGKPVYMFDLNTGVHAMRDNAPSDGGNDFRLTAWTYRAMMRWGWQRLSRDITLVHKALVDAGQASWLGENALSSCTGQRDDIEQAVTRMRELAARK